MRKLKPSAGRHEPETPEESAVLSVCPRCRFRLLADLPSCPRCRGRLTPREAA